MRIELLGVIKTVGEGHEYVDLLVTEDRADNCVKHRMGVDIKVNRVKILSFLSGVYSMPAGDIIWPGHIKVSEMKGDANDVGNL